jgi:hypothetical protein
MMAMAWGGVFLWSFYRFPFSFSVFTPFLPGVAFVPTLTIEKLT